VLLDVVLLAQFGQTFGERVRLRDYAGLVLGAYPFQVVLSVAAVWATARFTLGRNNWVKTRHEGVHLGAAAARSPQPAFAQEPS
jgi:glycosyltransferase XagB